MRRLANIQSAAAAAALALAPLVARASTFERIPDLAPCQEAALFADDDGGEDAERARRRCRLEQFTRQQNEARQQKTAAAERRRAELARAALEKNQSSREGQTFAVDFFAGGALAVYGVAFAFLPRPDIELELWYGSAGSDSIYNGQRSVNASGSGGGVRIKGYVGDGPLAPFFSGGIGGTRADLAAFTYDGRTSMNLSGSGWAHAVDGGVGLALATKFGFRMSLEYVFTYFIYHQAALDVPGKPQSAELKDAYGDVLDSHQHSVRFQVGYAF